MFKNALIAILTTLLILQHPAYAMYKNIAVFLAVAAVLFCTISVTEDSWERYKVRIWRQKKFKKQVENIHLPKDRRHA